MSGCAYGTRLRDALQILPVWFLDLAILNVVK